MEYLTSIKRLVAPSLRAGWIVLARSLRAIFMLLLALVLLFEEWGWRPLGELLARLARFKPWARIEAWIAGLPSYPALLMFALPATLLLPVKLGALVLLAQGKVLSATLLLIGAKIAGTALVARIFMLTKPALMQLSWFARLYGWFMPWKEALLDRIQASHAWRYGHMLKTRLTHEARMAWLRWRPLLVSGWARVRPTIADWKLRWRSAVARVRQRVRAMLSGRA